MGVDDTGIRMFETDPSGAMQEWSAVAIGAKKAEAEKIFEKEYKDDMSFEDTVKLALSTLSQVGEKQISKDNVNLSYIDDKIRKYTPLTGDELEGYIKGMAGKK